MGQTKAKARGPEAMTRRKGLAQTKKERDLAQTMKVQMMKALTMRVQTKRGMMRRMKTRMSLMRKKKVMETSLMTTKMSLTRMTWKMRTRKKAKAMTEPFYRHENRSRLRFSQHRLLGKTDPNYIQCLISHF